MAFPTVCILRRSYLCIRSIGEICFQDTQELSRIAEGAISYFPITTMVIKEGVIPVDVDLLAIGFPKIGVLMFGCSSELEFGSGC